MNFLIIKLKKHAIKLFLFFDDLFKPIDGLHLWMLLFFPIDHVDNCPFLSCVGICEGVQWKLLFFKESDLSFQGYTKKGKICVNVEIIHDLFP